MKLHKIDITGGLCAAVFVGLYDSNIFRAIKFLGIYFGIMIGFNALAMLVLEFKQRFSK
jgi:hypothetical protein